MERHLDYKCGAGRKITIEIAGGDNAVIIWVDGANQLFSPLGVRTVVAEARYSQGKKLIETCNRCTGSPSRLCDLSIDTKDLSKQVS